jgi:spermidine/putrescine ABC transporter ATP-binding subunit
MELSIGPRTATTEPARKLEAARSVMVSLRQVSKNFAGFVALHGIDLDIRKGEFLSLLGPSGCGKTTTLSLIAGFLQPSGGNICIDGQDVTGVPSHRRDVGVVFQNYALFPHLSVFDNVAFALRIRRIGRTEIAKRVRDALEMVQLGGLAARMPRQLSGGQQQRVALARALVYRPGVLLMDEPLAALDPNLREAMQLEIKRLHRTFEITTIYVTHDQHEALMLSDRIAVMRSGAIEQCGTPRSVYERPETEFVARFVGDANVLRATVVGAAGTLLQVATGSGTPVRLESRFAVDAGTELKIAVRPERIKLHKAAPGSVPCAQGIVREIHYHGETTRVHVELASGETLTVSRHNDRDGVELVPNQTVFASWSENDMVLLRGD